MWLALAHFSYLLHFLSLLNCTTCVLNAAKMMILECFQPQIDLKAFIIWSLPVGKADKANPEIEVKNQNIYI